MNTLRLSCYKLRIPFPINILKHPFPHLLYFGKRILHALSITFMLNGIAMKEMTPYRIRTQTSVPWRLNFRSLFLLTPCSCCRDFFFQEQLRFFFHLIFFFCHRSLQREEEGTACWISDVTAADRWVSGNSLGPWPLQWFYHSKLNYSGVSRSTANSSPFLIKTLQSK